MDLKLYGDENYISADEIAARVKQMGAYYSVKYGTNEVVVITMMNGAKVFGTDLTRAIENPNLLDDNMRVASYEGTASGGEVRYHYESSLDLRDRDVLLIEDILDTGATLSRVIPQLWERKPKSLSLACMFEKPAKRLPKTDFTVDDMQIGMQIADKFILGYGLDWKDPDGISRYRNLPYITAAKLVKINGRDWVEPVVSIN